MELRRGRAASGCGSFIVLAFAAVFTLLPLYVALVTAFKTNSAILRHPLALPSSLYLENFATVFGRRGFLRALLNSVFITSVSLGLQLVMIPMAAYPIARFRTRLNALVYIFFTAGLMIPFQVIMIPLVQQLKSLAMLGTYAGIIAVYVSGAPSFGVLLFVGFLRSVPVELDESGIMDGAGYLRVFWNILFPVLKPCTMTLLIFNTVGIWNDFLTPILIMNGPKGQTMTVAIYSFVARYANTWGPIFAGSVIVVTPMIILYIMLQKYFVKGLTAGAIKG
jgi:raffinose/stachyose/melibiose transport system permease protein